MALTDEERYDLRTQTKIEMLKEHLKLHMSEDYLYTPKNNHAGKLLTLLTSRSPKLDEEEAEAPKA